MKKYKFLTMTVVAMVLMSSCKDEPKGDNAKGYYLAVTSSDEWGNESIISNSEYAEQVMAPTEAGVALTSRSDAMTMAGMSSAARFAVNKAAYQSTENAVPSVVRVKFRSSLSSQALARVSGGSVITGFQNFDRACSMVNGGVKMEQVFRCGTRDMESHRQAGLDRWYDIVFDKSQNSLQKTIELYSELQELEVVETIKRVKPVDKGVRYAAASIAENGATKVVELPFNDPKLNLQWNYDNMGVDDKIHPRSGIDLLKAWKKSTGDKDVIVAIVAGGIDYKHEDLVEAMWVNKDELPDNNIDDDGNGFVDDVCGYNFAPIMTDEGLWPDPPYQKVGKIKPSSNGTMVAGTIGAVNNNGIGVCGIAGGSGLGDGVRLMSCQVFGVKDAAEGVFIAEAIVYAADQGAVITHNNWTYGNADEGSIATEDAMAYFVRNAGDRVKFPTSPMEGGIVIVAAGNKNNMTPMMPATFSNVMPVAATNHLRTKTDYSNYGNWVALAAPGGNSASSTEKMGILSTDTSNTYSYVSSTAMSTAHVVGVASLVISQNKGAITPGILRKWLLGSCENISDTDLNYATLMGAGLINANNALREDDKIAPSEITNLTVTNDGENTVLKWTVPGDKNDTAKTYTIYYSKDPITSTTELATLKKMVGEYPVTAVAGGEFVKRIK